MIRLATMLMCVSLGGCAAAVPQAQAVDAGAEVTLAPGQWVSVKTTSMKIGFIAVTEDSRCPRDVTCIWAGEIKVQLEIREASQGASKVEILEGGSTVAGVHRVTLVRVEPLPTSTAKIAAQDYRATLKIDKPG